MVNDVLGHLLAFVDGVAPVWRILLAAVGILLETSVLVGLVVPGDTIVLVAALATPDPLQNPTQYIALVLAVVAGALLGESAGFALGRWFGHRLRPSRLGRRMGEQNWARAERFLARRGGVAVLVSRFLPVLHSLVPLTVGMSRMRYRTFIGWTLPACALWALLYVTVGTAAGGVTRDLLTQQLHWAGYALAGILAVFLLLVWGGKKLLHALSERHMHADDGDAPE